MSIDIFSFVPRLSAWSFKGVTDVGFPPASPELAMAGRPTPSLFSAFCWNGIAEEITFFVMNK
jgi:hypothetical protein